MPKIGKTPRKKAPKIELTCAACGNLKNGTEFYKSYNIVHSTGKIPYCKDCLKKMISDKNGNVEIEKVKSTLQLIDKPFLYTIWKISLEDKMDTFGCYIKNIQMPQYRNLGWAESSMLPEVEYDLNYDNVFDFEITSEMINRWGNHEKEDYIKLESFYNDMKISNNIETAQDMVYLKKLATISLKMDKSLEDGNYDDAKKLGDLFSKYMGDSKFRAMDKSDADKTGGIRNFGAIYAEVEKDGFIPPWEYYRKIKGITQDIVDKTIMHIENFTLKLNKIEKMTSPPSDTPKLEDYEIDYENEIMINDIAVDLEKNGSDD